MSKSLTEAAKEILGGNVASKKSAQDGPKKLGGDAPTALQPPKSPEDNETLKDTSSGKATPPGMPAPVGQEPRKSLSPSTNTGGPEAPVSKPARGKVSDGVNKEEQDDDLYEEVDEDIEIGDIVEDADGNVGEVVGINEETGEVEVNWQELTEEKDDEDDSEDDEDDSEDKDDDKEEKKDDIKESLTFDLADDVAAMFNGNDELSEEFKTKVTTIFEAAVKARVYEYADKLDEAYDKKLEEAVEATVEEISESVESYLNHTVNEWVKDNEVAIETNLRTELTEDFIVGLRNLFLENYIDVPDEKLDIVEELSEKLEVLEGKLNEQIEKNIAITETLAEARKDQILHKMCEGLVETQRDKLISLAENVEFKDVEAFEEAISTLKENYFPVDSKSKLGATELDDTATLVEEKTGKVVETIVENTNDPMDRYVRAIKRSS